MYEEGCITIEHNGYERFMVVSLEQSLKSDNESNTRLAYEIKCQSARHIHTMPITNTRILCPSNVM